MQHGTELWQPSSGLGSRIRQRRTELGLSQRELAQRSGVVHTHISRIELDRTGVSVAVLQRISAVLQTSIEWFVDQKSQPGGLDSDTGSANLSTQERALLGLFRKLAQADRDYFHRFLLLLGNYTAGAAPEPSRRAQRRIAWQPVNKKEASEPVYDGAIIGKGHSIFVARDDVMSGVGIYSASMIAVRPPPAKSGDIVVAEIEESEIIIRYYYPRSSNRIEFRAAKAGVKSLLVEQKAVNVLGVVTHVRSEMARRSTTSK